MTSFLGIPLATGILIAFSLLGCETELQRLGWPSSEASVYALLLVLQVELLLLPLASASLLDKTPIRGFFWISLIAIGIGMGWAVRSALPLLSFFWAQGIIVAAGFFSVAAGRLFRRFSPAIARMMVAFLAMFLCTSYFWTAEVVRMLSPTSRGMGEVVAVWLAPGLVLTLPFQGLPWGLLPSLYEMWLGPIVPYPSHPSHILFGYLVLGGIALFLTWGMEGEDPSIRLP